MKNKPTALITSGPTRERIDPVRFISNFSSGKQGHAIACALRDAGFDVTLVTGPVDIPAPEGMKVIQIESAAEMLESCLSCLPVDVAICAAAVSDFRPVISVTQKIKKQAGIIETTLQLVQNPDILATISNHTLRPKIVVGFAAETENLLENARKKLNSKNCDIIIANNVAENNIFGQQDTCVSIISHLEVVELGKTTKTALASHIASQIPKLLKFK